MSNRNKRIPFISKILKHSDFATPIQISFSTKTAGAGYDPYEDNYTYTSLNPISIKGYVNEVSPQALVYKMYGLQNMGAKEIICDAKYKNHFTLANKIEIDGDNYTVFKEGTGGKTLISNLTKKLIKVVVTRDD